MTDPGMEQLEDMSWLDGVEPEAVDDILGPSPATDDVVTETVTAVSDDIVKTKRRKPHAKAYEDKVLGSLRTVAQLAAPHPATIADAAAIVLYGPPLAVALGDLAAENKNVAQAIEFVTGGTENPAAAAILCAAPLVIQLVRNHEPQLEPNIRGLRIPFVKGPDGQPRILRLRFGVKLGNLRAMSNDPAALVQHVVSFPKIREAFQRWGVRFE